WNRRGGAQRRDGRWIEELPVPRSTILTLLPSPALRATQTSWALRNPICHRCRRYGQGLPCSRPTVESPCGYQSSPTTVVEQLRHEGTIRSRDADYRAGTAVRSTS